MLEQLGLQSSPILAPVMALVLWSLIMMLWMAATRLSIIPKLKIRPEAGERTSELAKLLPAKTQWKADNYNHLMEQPTIFYATVFALALMGAGDGLNLTLAWIYVVLRIAHSLVHVTINKVVIRFSLFFLSSIILIILAIRAAILAF